MKYENAIWEGRFQPLHRGHVEYVKLVLTHAKRIWLVVVENERAQNNTAVADLFDLPVPEFTALIDQNHVPEKNPLPLWLRYKIVKETLSEELPNQEIHVWAGRRLDLQWHFYDKALPPERVFFTPIRDEFEDAKAAAWKKLRQSVVRLDVQNLPHFSATTVRRRVENAESVSEYLCPRTEAILQEFGYLPPKGQ